MVFRERKNETLARNGFLGVKYRYPENHAVSFYISAQRREKSRAILKGGYHETLDRLAYTPTEAAEVASVSRPTIYRWMHLEGFPVAHIGGCTRIPAEAFKQ